MKKHGKASSVVFMLDDSFKIIYSDENALRLFPGAKSGEYCYKALWGKEDVCSDCPLAESERTGQPLQSLCRSNYKASYTRMFSSDGKSSYVVSLSDVKGYGGDGGIIDPLTGLYRQDGFKAAVAQKLADDGRDFFIAYIDIKHFKLYNDWHGFAAGDMLLINLAGFAEETAQAEQGVAGYFGSDDFALLLPVENNGAERFIDGLKKWADDVNLEINFSPAVGLYKIDDRAVSVDLMCDYAVIAMNSSKDDYTTPYKWYDEKMRIRLEEEQTLFAEAKKALENREFKVYFQPKCNMANGKIVGIEALVRWPHPVKGMISPGRFIPMLEKNGFIHRLDLYVWEEVCRYQRRLLDKGRMPLPVSVNVSRVDIYKENVPELLNALIQKYRLPSELIELEITESAYMSDYHQLEGVVRNLRQHGFTVLMDDFGSGYSSLNMLKDIEVDIIKIDMKFLEMSEETRQKGGSILESIIRMAKWLGYRVIAEGTETIQQVDDLLKMGCQYGQGYHFYRPMPYEEYEKLIEDESLIDRNGIQPVRLEEVGLTELFHNDVMTESMLSNIMGAVALYTLENGEMTLLRANKQYYNTVGREHRYGSESHDRIFDFIVEQDIAVFREALERAQKNGNEGASCTIRIKRETDRKIMWGHCRLFFLREHKGVGFFYATINDVTAEKESEQELRESQQQLSAALGAIHADGTLKSLRDQNRIAAINVFSELTPGGMCGGYCEQGFPIYYANDGMVKLAGYDSYDEMVEAVGGLIMNMVCEEDRGRLIRAVPFDDKCAEGQQYEVKYRLICKDGSLKWVANAGRVIHAEDGRLAIVSAVYDITDVIEAEEKARKAVKELEKSNRELSILVNNLPIGYCKFSYTDDPVIKYASSRFLELIECTAEELHEKYNDRFSCFIHPDDLGATTKSFFNEEMPAVRYRIVTKSGTKVVLGTANLVREDDGSSNVYCLIQDVTESVKLRHQRRVVMENCPGDIFKATGSSMEFFSYNRGVLLGYTQEEYSERIRSMGSGSLTFEDDKEIVREAFTNAYKNRTDISVLFRSVRKDGGLSWTKMSAKCEIENGEPVFYGILQDMDEMVLIRNSMKSILDCIAGDVVRIYVGEKTFRIEVLSGNLGKYLGYGDEEMCVKIMNEMGEAFYHPEDLEKMALLCALRYNDHEPVEVSARCLCNNGEYCRVKCRAMYSHVNGDGQAVYDGTLVIDNQ